MSLIENPTASFEARLVHAITSALKTSIESIVEEEAKKAAANVERRVREKTAQIAASVLERYSMERIGPDLRITVRLPKE